MTSLSLSLSFPGGSDGKTFVYNAGDLGLIPGSGRFPGEGNGNLLQYYCLESPTDRGCYSPWGVKESDMTERLQFPFLSFPYTNINNSPIIQQ